VTWRVLVGAGWRRLVLCGALAVAGCTQPTPDPAQPTAPAQPSASAATTVGDPTVVAGPTASVVPSPTAGPTAPVLIQFEPLRSRGNGSGGADVTRADRLDEFLDRHDLDQNGLNYSPQEQILPWLALGARVLAFVLAGCGNDGATLVVESARVYADLTGGGNVQCDAPQYYFAVFAVPAGLVPAGARIG
jgi:hypothetical protein